MEKMDQEIQKVAKYLLAKYGSLESISKAIETYVPEPVKPLSWVQEKLLSFFWKAKKLGKDSGISFLCPDKSSHRFYVSRNGDICYVRVPADHNWDSEVFYNQFLEKDGIEAISIINKLHIVAIQEIGYMQVKRITKADSRPGRKPKPRSPEEIKKIKEDLIKILEM
ncbi:MAG: hypothetical protein ACTSRG_25110 [Candidatus Helarchaeota archaeon]